MVEGWSVRGLVVRAGPFAVGPVDLDLAPGDSVAVVGRSGAGKTTFLRGLAGLAPVEAGRVLRGREDVTDAPPERRRLGYVPQGLGLLSHRSVERNVAYPFELRGARSDPRVGRLLERFGLAELRGRRAAQLSAGEQQRVAMARALAADPALLVWDEPLSGLDVVARDDLLALLADVQRSEGIPLLLVTHDPTAAFSIADRLLVLEAGGVAHLGPSLPVSEAPTDPFLARFVGFENVFGPDDLARTKAGEFARWLADRAGPGGVVFHASAARPVRAGETAPFSAVLRRVSPGPEGITLLAESGGLGLRMRALPTGGALRPGDAFGFALDPAALRPLPRPVRAEAGG